VIRRQLAGDVVEEEIVKGWAAVGEKEESIAAAITKGPFNVRRLNSSFGGYLERSRCGSRYAKLLTDWFADLTGAGISLGRVSRIYLTGASGEARKFYVLEGQNGFVKTLVLPNSAEKRAGFEGLRFGSWKLR